MNQSPSANRFQNPSTFCKHFYPKSSTFPQDYQLGNQTSCKDSRQQFLTGLHEVIFCGYF